MATDYQPETRTVVAVLGASPNTDRYAWRAQQALEEHHCRVVPVSARYDEVGGIAAVRSLLDIPETIHTVTVYLNPAHLAEYVDQIIAVRPKRVIFNPGSEAPEIIEKLEKNGIRVELACTLVMLRTGRF